MNDVALRFDPQNPADWASRITSCWRQSVQAILDTGRLIAEAKAALPHGEFRAMIDAMLPFGARTAQRLMQISADERLSKATHASLLPPSWMTLYEITKLDDAALEKKIADGTIHPEMERRDIATTVKRQARETREALLGQQQRALPQKKYGVISADPEWRFQPRSRVTGMDRSADNHYPTSETDAIAARPVGTIAADDCVLFLWATAPMLPDALRVLAAWGFTYKTHCIWHKTRSGDGRGSGYWFTGEHELLLVGTRGNIPAPATAFGPSIVEAPWQGRHSAKPEIFAAMIETLFPTLPKIELNRRGPARPGWDAWGNEAETESRAKAEEAVRPDNAQAEGMLPRGDGGSESDLADDAASRLAAGRTADDTEDISGDSRERPAPDSSEPEEGFLSRFKRLVGLNPDSRVTKAEAEAEAPAFLIRDKSNHAPFMRGGEDEHARS